jgi:hypothetical protein
VNVLNSTYQFDVNGTSRFSNTVQLDTVNLGLNDVKILTLNTGNTIQYRDISDVLNTVTADTYVTGFTYLNNTFTIKDNSGNTFNTTIDVMTGLTVNGDLTVTGNTTAGNLVTSNAVFASNVVVSNRMDVIGTMRVRGGVTMDDNLSVEGDMGVFGDFEIKGNLIYDTDIFTISANVPVTTGYAYFGVNRGNTMSQLGTVNANAYIRWSGFDNIFEIRDVFNPNNATSYSKIVTANLISSSLNSQSIETIASSLAANSLNVNIVTANTNMRNYVDANVAILGQRVDGANAAIVTANTAMKQYVDANVAILGQRVNGANATIVTANNAMKTYVDATFLQRVGGTISGDLVVTGNLSISGNTTVINTQQLNIGDNIVVLNSDLPTGATPSENSGIEINRGASANVVLLWNETTDRWTFTNDGTNYSNIGSSSSELYANSAYSQANTATTNAATADQRAVTSGSYANSAFTQANSAFTNANTRVSKSGDTMTGNLIMSGANSNIFGASTSILDGFIIDCGTYT